MDKLTDWVVVARLLRAQGRNGEILSELLTDFPERFVPGSTVYLAPEGFRGLCSDARAVEVVSAWEPQGRNEGRIVLGFAGITSIDAVSELRGLDVLVPESDLAPLEEEAAYVHELVGSTLFDGDREVGVISDVQFTLSADGKRRLADAASLLAIDLPAGEVLIPFAKDLLVSMDLPNRKIVMRLPEGLIDLNLRPAGPKKP